MSRLTSRRRKFLNPTTKRILSVVVVGSVFAFFWQSLSGNWERVQQYSVGFSANFVLSFGVFALAVLSSGVLAGLVLRALGQRAVNITSATRAHLGSWVIRYIPSVAQPMYKMNWAAQNGIRRSVGLLAFLYEFAFMQIASVIGSLALIFLVRNESFSNEQILVWGSLLFASGLAAIIALRYLVNPVASRISQMRKLNGNERLPVMTWFAILSLLAGFIIPRIINGLGVGLVTLSLIPDMTIDSVLVVAAVYTIASAVGVLWVFVPSGIGVREATFVALLAALGFSIVDGIIISVVVRLISTLSDVLVAVIFVGMKYITPESTSEEKGN